MQRRAEEIRRSNRGIGFVPTMGFLHEGHLSLIRKARELADVVVVSIFVNPAQFAPNEDFVSYPRDEARDARLAEEAGCELLFIPSEKDMYPDGYSTFVQIDGLSSIWEGELRPTHFRGVTTVVAKLFNIVKPRVAVFGRKDTQQALIVKRMAADLNMDVLVHVAPIVREPDGLAMSSRNTYLTPAQRVEALAISRALRLAESRFDEGERDPEILRAAVMRELAGSSEVRVEYVAVTDPVTMAPLANNDAADEMLIAVAARVGKTRLIDNILLNKSTTS
jgi:pantoate--beta-alanine ligase